MAKQSSFPKSAITILVVLNLMLLALVTYFMFTRPFMQISNLHRINIQDESGHNRVVISNQQQIPPPIIGGKQYQRRMTPAGLIFYDENGDERGGIAISTSGEKHINALAFDYQNADAIGLMAIDDNTGDYHKAALIINAKDNSEDPGANINRINLFTENGNAALVMNDANQVPRLILKVDSSGTPSIEMYDAGGKRSKIVGFE